ncbi:MAG: hypothetical protein GY820_18685 [Gammaproteobacteria bacterium]|nr:hypothetical protein [Gammaproteobacteria bacterium]
MGTTLFAGVRSQGAVSDETQLEIEVNNSGILDNPDSMQAHKHKWQAGKHKCSTGKSGL